MNKTIMYQEIISQPEKLRDCYNTNKDIICLIANTIKAFEPNNIVLVARGTSLHSAYYAKQMLEVYYNIPVSIANPSVFTVYNSNLKMDKTFLIAITQSGKGKDILKVVEKANESGALTLSITNDSESAVAKESKYNLYNEVGEAVAYAATKTYTSTIYLLTKLIFEISNIADLDLDDEEVFKAVENSFQYYEQIKEDVKMFKDFNYAMSISRGYLMTLAHEMALKIKETCHYPMDAYQASEFYHGPISAAGKNTPALFFALDEKTNMNNLNLIKDLKKLGCFTYVITNKGDILEECGKGIYINESRDLYALFTAIGIMQLLTCELAVLNGHNPDFMKILEHIDTI